MANDFIIDDTGDIAVHKGDFVLGESFNQEVTSILMANKGEYKETPLLGPNMVRRMKSKADMLSLRREVGISLEIDNKSLESLIIENNKLLNISVK